MSALLRPEGQRALAVAAEQDDPDSLAAAAAVRAVAPAELAAAALTQVALRRRAVTKFGDLAPELFFTRDGLEQATRPRVSRRRAARLVELGATRVVDLGCGIGADARAFAEVGLEVLAVERDPETAELAALNLAAFPQADVVVGDVLDLVDPASPATPGTAVFLDPARRTGAGRTWDVADLTPPWSFVESMLGRGQLVVVKLGPGVPDRILPADGAVEFVADSGDVVETTVWHGPGIDPGRGAVLLEANGETQVVRSGRRFGDGGHRIGAWLLEPAGAVLRADAAPDLPGAQDWWAPFPGVAYLASDTPGEGPGVTNFEVLETFPWSEKALRTWCREHRVGVLEIKKRGIEVDPAALRRRLRLDGPEHASVVITPHRSGHHHGAQVLVVRR